MRMSSQLRHVLMGLFVSAALLLFAELLSRVAKTFDVDRDSTVSLAPADGFAYSAKLGWERKPGYNGVAVGGHEREFDAAGYVTADSTQVSDTTKPKIVFIGDSNTFGYGVSTRSSFVEVVERLLSDVNAINLGVIGYTSYQGRVTFEQYAPILKPDLVVVSFNYNDRRAVIDSSLVDGEEAFERMYATRSNFLASVAGMLDASYFVRALRRVMIAGGLMGDSGGKRIDAWRPRVSEEAYRRNLSKIAEEAKRSGIPLMFLLLKDNPLESYHLNEGIKSLEGAVGIQSESMAIAHLAVAAESTNMFTDLARLYLAKAYQAQGNEGKARTALVSPLPFKSLQGGRPIRLDTTYNDIMRQVAGVYGVELVDATKIQDAYPDAYIDFCHFNEDGHRRVAELLAGRIAHFLTIHARQARGVRRE